MDAVIYALFLLIGIALGYVIRHLLVQSKSISSSDYNKALAEKDTIIATLQIRDNDLKHSTESLKKLEEEKLQLLQRIEILTYDSGSLRTQAEEGQTRLVTMETTLEREQEKAQTERNARQELYAEKTRVDAMLESAQKNLEKLQQTADEWEAEINKLRGELLESKQHLSAYEEKNKYLEEKLQGQKREIEEVRENFNKEFQLIADKILEQKSQKFTEQNQQNLKILLDPLGKNIEEFKKQVQESYNAEGKERHTLEARIIDLTRLNETLSKEAKNLTQALKGNVKQQGNWGEMILESILQNSGLVKDVEYVVQAMIKDESGNNIIDDNGKKLQPDVIINLPDKRQIVIDSKVSLLAYDKFVAADDRESQELSVGEHIRSIKAHIDSLSGKNYPKHLQSLDFTMMFVPVEPAYMIAMQHDPTLWEYAYTKRILLISPTNLIAALKLINDLWKREQQTRNALEIADRGAKLYEKFVNFIESMEKIGESIEKAQKSHTEAMKQLSTGSGNLIGQVEKLKRLGVSASKNIPAQLIEPDEDLEL